MKNKLLLPVIIFVLVAAGFYFYINSEEEVDQAQQNDVISDSEGSSEEDMKTRGEMNEESEDNKEEDKTKEEVSVEEMIYQFRGELFDVTDGATVTGVNTGNKATGEAQANFEDGEYSLKATFKDLPDPQGTDFYEGWVVRKGLSFSVISTGRAEKVDGEYQNIYKSQEDLLDHDFYVLTIEPDDGDPEPAEHILEGTMKSIE